MNIDIGIAIFLILRWAMNKIPKNNSRPIINLAAHSAIVQFKKVVSTIVHPNCSIVGILERAENINTAPIKTLRIDTRTFLKIDGLFIL